MKDAFNLRTIPDVCITMGFPSRRARTRSSNRAPGEILVEEWKGTGIEKALVSIHPERFESVEQVALSTLFVIGNEMYGSRRNSGALTLGVVMDKQSGDLTYTSDEKGTHSKNTLNHIVRNLGAIPQGFAEMPEPVQRVQNTRNLKYACNVCGTVLRTAGQVLEAMCMHGGKPQHGQPPGSFILHLTKKQEKAQAAAVPEVPQVQPQASAAPAAGSREEVANIAKLTRAGALRVQQVPGGRAFGAEA